MDSGVLATLEFDKIRKLLAERAAFSLGKAHAESLVPSTSILQAERRQEETAQAVRLIELAGSFPLGGMRDVRPLVRRAALGAVLREDELVDVAQAARAIGRLRRYFLEHGEEAKAPELSDLALTMGQFDGLEREINRCIDQEGRVADHATPELAKIRASLRTLRQRVRDHLDRLVRSAQGQRYLQEPIVTLRSGRFVVLVKQEYRNEIPGIVHDQSASGATLFIEPLAVVEANNDVRNAEKREEAEVERVLALLSQKVAERADELVHAVEIAGELDFIGAKARLAIDWRAVKPKLNDRGVLDIKAGRHPLLSGEVVPVDVRLGDTYTALIITGPNTGGKTVTLKTVGLFSLMAQAGLHLPSELETEVCVFARIFADIGDEQSIEQSLSTFSSHMSKIVKILGEVDERSLVLLDELGAGTDPDEGAALAIALLDHLCSVGCRVVATTHYSELKNFAYTHPKCENASVEFDVRTLRPTYKLRIGVAGKSNAFAIARRLGLDERIVARARAELSEETRRVDKLLSSVETDRRVAAKEREDAQTLRRRYEELADRYHEAFERLKADREAVLEEARWEAEELLRRAKSEADALLGRLRKAGAAEVEEEARAVRSRLEEAANELASRAGDERAAHPVRSGARRQPLRVEPAVGMRVEIRSLNQTGEIVQVLPGDKVVVQAGPMRITVGRDDLDVLGGRRSAPERKPAPASVSLSGVDSSDVRSEVDLRGLLVEEALEKTDKYLDNAVVAGFSPVRLIHGKGTGALRLAIHDYLRTHPRVESFQVAPANEGGLGVTIVHLR